MRATPTVIGSPTRSRTSRRNARRSRAGGPKPCATRRRRGTLRRRRCLRRAGSCPRTRRRRPGSLPGPPIRGETTIAAGTTVVPVRRPSPSGRRTPAPVARRDHDAAADDQAAREGADRPAARPMRRRRRDRRAGSWHRCPAARPRGGHEHMFAHPMTPPRKAHSPGPARFVSQIPARIAGSGDTNPKPNAASWLRRQSAAPDSRRCRIRQFATDRATIVTSSSRTTASRPAGSRHARGARRVVDEADEVARDTHVGESCAMPVSAARAAARRGTRTRATTPRPAG